MTASIKKSPLTILFCFIFTIFPACAQQKVIGNSDLAGIDILLRDSLYLLKNKNIGLVVNQTSVLQSGKHVIDTLVTLKTAKTIKIFAPEHGFRGNFEAGGKFSNTIDKTTGLQIVSLYGKKTAPDSVDLKEIDLLIFDIQDVGVRFYTYISTLYYVIEACQKYNKQLIIVDRPNPIELYKIDGPITDDEHISFISIAKIPVIHGQTIGKLSKVFRSFLEHKNKKLINIKIIDHEISAISDYFNKKWVNPSPNLNSYNAALAYPTTCFFEGTNISEGRGTDKPFLQFGAPFINSTKILKELKKLLIEGVDFDSIRFTPKSIAGMAQSPKFENQLCYGIKINIKDPRIFDPLLTALHLIQVIKIFHPEYFEYRVSHFDLLWGTSEVRKMIDSNISPETIKEKWRKDLEIYYIMIKRN